MRSFFSILILGLIVAGFAPVSGEPPAAKPAATVAVEEVRGDALNAAIAKHKDKVVVVDLWATWCTSCVKKFPHFVELHKKYADKGLVCISVSMDRLTPTTYKKQSVLDFLKQKNAAFPNYVVLEPEDDEKALAARFGEDYRLIPLMVIYDKAGRSVWNSGDGPKMTDEQLDKKIEELLAK
ncbi:MAG TPA: thioredoxin-like domain-containing protein [Urbifossiella sp.]